MYILAEKCRTLPSVAQERNAQIKPFIQLVGCRSGSMIGECMGNLEHSIMWYP